MAISVGTSGYSYKEWKGSFYPADVRAGQMLRFYGERFDAVIKSVIGRRLTYEQLIGALNAGTLPA